MQGGVLEFEIDDDSGLLALVAASDYKSFVGADWTYEQLLDHFAAQTRARRILVWECGDGGNLYRVQIAAGFSNATGHREFTGAIHSTTGKLHLASYTALTMAAQFEDYEIPGKDEAALFIELPATPTKIRVIQMYDPDSTDNAPAAAPHFRIEYEPGEGEGWTDVAWESKRAPREPQGRLKPGAIARLFSGLFGKGR